MDKDIIKQTLDRHVKDAYKRGYFNGCILLAHKDEIVYETALGFADMKTKRELSIDSVFELASITKQFTAGAIMILRDRSLLSLEDELEKFFPGIPYKGRTIKNLLNHTGGLPDYMQWVEQKSNECGCIPTNAIVEKFILESGLPALFDVNEEWSYSNTGYVLLALIIEKVSGLSYEDFLEKEIFIPAGMEHTCVYHRRMKGDTIKDYAYGYIIENGRYILPDVSAECKYVISLDGNAGDKSVNSNVHDLLKWSLALKEGKTLSIENRKEMHTPTKYGHGKVKGYGYGWFIRDDDRMGRIIHHSGGWPGCYTEFILYPDKDITLVSLMNVDSPDTWGEITFTEGLLDIVKGGQPEPIRALQELLDYNSDSSGYTDLCGKYERCTEVFLKGDKLCITSQLFEKALELHPAKGAYFITKEGYKIILDGNYMIVDTVNLSPTVLKKINN